MTAAKTLSSAASSFISDIYKTKFNCKTAPLREMHAAEPFLYVYSVFSRFLIYFATSLQNSRNA